MLVGRQSPALKSFEVKREPISGEVLGVSVQAVINSAAIPGEGEWIHMDALGKHSLSTGCFF